MKNVERKQRLKKNATSVFESLPPAMARRLKEIIDDGFGIVDIMNGVGERLSGMIDDGTVTNVDEGRVMGDIWGAMASGNIRDLMDQLQEKKREDARNGVPFTLGGLEVLLKEAESAMRSAGMDTTSPIEMEFEMPIDLAGWKYEDVAKRLVERNREQGNDEWNDAYENGWFVVHLRPGDGGGYTTLGPEFLINIEASSRAQAWDIGRHEVKHAVAGVMSILVSGKPGTSFGVPPGEYADRGVRQGVPHYVDREDKEGNPISHGLTPNESYQRDDFEFYVRMADAIKKIVEMYGWGVVEEKDDTGRTVAKKTTRENPAPESERMKVVREILSWDDHPQQTLEDIEEGERMRDIMRRNVLFKMFGPGMADEPSEEELEEARAFVERQRELAEERKKFKERKRRGEVTGDELKDDKIKEIRFYLGLPAVANNSGKMKKLVDILLDKYVYMNDIGEMMEQPYDDGRAASFFTWMDKYASVEKVWTSFGRNA